MIVSIVSGVMIGKFISWQDRTPAKSEVRENRRLVNTSLVLTS
jgi:hypothetical protein